MASTEPRSWVLRTASLPRTMLARSGLAPRDLVLVIGVLAVAANLRPALSSLPPLLTTIQGELGVPSVVVAALTAAPVLGFGILAPLARPLAGRVGHEATVFLALVALAAGLLLRLGPTAATLFGGTFLAGSAIAVLNVMLPVIVRARLPRQIGLLTGGYVTILTLGSAIAAGTTVPIAQLLGLGWRGGLGVWCLPVLAAALLWVGQFRGRSGPLVPSRTGRRIRLLGNGKAWAIALLFGSESLGFYATLTWLPTIYQDHGYSLAAAGGLLSVSLLAGAAAALLVPTLATRANDQRAHLLATMVLLAIGLTGLLAWPLVAAPVWAALIGFGQTGLFSVALTLVGLRSREEDTTIHLSIFVQGWGYTIAATGPFLTGLLHDLTGGWEWSVVFLLLLIVPQIACALLAGRPGFVDEPWS